MTDDIHDRLDALSQANTALWNAIDELQTENTELHERLTELERITNPDPETTGYDALTREQKVFRLRRALVTKATTNGGHASMKYREVQATFSNHPSPGHAYDLMELAGNADGFNYNQDTGERRITVKTDAVNDEAYFRGANKTPVGTPA